LGCLSGFIHKEAFSVGEPVVVKLVISDGYLFSFHQSAKCWVSPLPEARLPLGRIKLTLKIQKKRKSKRKFLPYNLKSLILRSEPALHFCGAGFAVGDIRQLLKCK